MAGCILQHVSRSVPVSGARMSRDKCFCVMECLFPYDFCATLAFKVINSLEN